MLPIFISRRIHRNCARPRFAVTLINYAASCLLLLSFSPAWSAEIIRFQPKPIRIDDRFEVDTLKKYKVVGDVRWSTLKLVVPQGAAFTYQNTIDAEYKCEFDIWPVKFDAQQQCVSQFRFVMSNGWEHVIVIHRVRRGSQVARQVQVVAIQRSGQDAEPEIAQLRTSPVFVIDGDVERWSLKYNNGLIEIRCNDQVAATAHGQAFTSWCHVVALAQVAGDIELTRFALHARTTGYSRQQQELYKETNDLRAKAEAALANGDVDLAIRLEQQKIPVMERAFGKDFVAIALTHQWIAEVADDLKHYQAAREYFQQSADVFAKTLGEGHPQTLRARGQSCYADAMLGNVDRAEKSLRTIVAEHVRLAGDQDEASQQLLAFFLNALALKGENLLKKKKFDEHVQCYTELVELWARLEGTDTAEAHDWRVSRDVAIEISQADSAKQDQICKILDDIGKFEQLRAEGNATAAETLAKSTLTDCRQVLGAQHTLTSVALANLGHCFIESGETKLGLQSLKEATEVRRNLYGDADPTVAFGECILASAYSGAGQVDKATRLFEAAIPTLHKKDRPSQPLSVANVLFLYGDHLSRTGKKQAALEQLTFSIRAFQDNGASSDPEAIAAFELLAEIYRSTGNDESANQILQLQQVLSAEGEAGATASHVAMLTAQARQLYLNREFDQAASHYYQALTYISRVFGRRSSTYEAALEGLFEVHLAQRNSAGIEKALDELSDFARLRREAQLSAASVREQFEYSVSDRRWLNRLMALATSDLVSVGTVYEHVLEFKGVVTINQRRIQLAASRAELRPLLVKWQEACTKISTILGQPVTPEAADALQNLVRTRDQLEAQMAAKSSEYRQLSNPLTVKKLQELLPANTAIVDYVEFERPANWLERIFSSTPGRSIAAFVVTKDAGVQMVELGNANAVDQALLAWASAIGAEVQNLGPTFDDSLETDTDQAGMAMRELIWDPLSQHLSGAQVVVVSPDTCLTLCPFPALPLADGKSYLVEKQTICHVPAVGLLPELWNTRSPKSATNFLLVGRIDYNEAKGLEPSMISRQDAPGSGGLYFDPVPPAAADTTKLQSAFRQRYPQGRLGELAAAKATEKIVRQNISQATFVYLNTHGFSMPFSELLAVRNPDRVIEPQAGEPMVSGVALAGANRALATDNHGDGILWAEEIASLDLSRTELVTLSACQTAVGDAIAGEGLQGAQRALAVAGAKTSLTSLWSVDAYATSTLMDQFHEGMWTRELGKSAALQQAMIYMLRKYRWANPSIAPATKGHRCPPFLWSAWVLYGDGR